MCIRGSCNRLLSKGQRILAPEGFPGSQNLQPKRLGPPKHVVDVYYGLRILGAHNTWRTFSQISLKMTKTGPLLPGSEALSCPEQKGRPAARFPFKTAQIWPQNLVLAAHPCPDHTDAAVTTENPSNFLPEPPRFLPKRRQVFGNHSNRPLSSGKAAVTMSGRGCQADFPLDKGRLLWFPNTWRRFGRNLGGSGRKFERCEPA